jgi:hypothetical protein
MPCIIIDNPGILRDVCKKCNAKPTHEGAETIIKNKRIIKHLNKYSREICGLTKDVWEKEYKQIASNFM